MAGKLIIDNSENIMMDLKKINPEFLKEYIFTKKQKFNVVKNQRYQEAAELRDREREIEREYPLLNEHREFIYENFDWILRDLKINDILE